MPPRRRLQFTQESIDQQLQQIHLLDSASSTENLEQLGPIIKQISVNRQQDAYLRTLKGLIESKDEEIERICADNYQDFVASVGTLFTLKSYTTNLRDKITTLDSSVSQVGKALVEKKKGLQQAKKTAANLDEAIDTLQACLRVMDVVNRVGKMIEDQKYWSALRSLEEIENMPATSVSQTPLFEHLLSSLPSLRAQIKDAVTASMKQWLLEIRNVSGQVGKLALESMETRSRKWRVKRDKDPLLKHERVGSAVEVVTNEKTEYDVLDNDKVRVDFKPLYQCIHMYTAQDSLDELKYSYQADRKAQSDLILPSAPALSSLPTLLQEITGFFIVESYVSRTTRNFRSDRDIEELWDEVIQRLKQAVFNSLGGESDPEVYLRVKEILMGFIMTLESYNFSTTELQTFIIVLFGKYTTLLDAHFSRRLAENVMTDDCQPLVVESPSARDATLTSVWISRSESEELSRLGLPATLPWSQSFVSCCRDIRSYVSKFYQFVEGVSQHHKNVDELLGKSLDTLLAKHVSDNLSKRVSSTSTLSQIVQIMTNLEHFEVACNELEKSLSSLRSAQRGARIHITASSAFSNVLDTATTRINTVITSKLDDFFELSEYDWTPRTREDAPSMYLYELVNWLTTVVDSLTLRDTYKDDAYRGAVGYIAECFMEFLVGRDTTVMNENGLSNILVDIDFLEEEFKRVGRPHLGTAFTELRSTLGIVMSDSIQAYLVPAVRQASYATVRPKRLQALLEKLARYGASTRDAMEREKGDRRRKEADAVGRLFPGESR